LLWPSCEFEAPIIAIQRYGPWVHHFFTVKAAAVFTTTTTASISTFRRNYGLAAQDHPFQDDLTA
jgi:hypothetical protein